MAQTKFGDLVANTTGDLPPVGSIAPAFILTGNDLKPISLADFTDKYVVLNIFPSIDTGTCATSVREFNKRAAGLDNTVVLCVSVDLPFAMRRFCGAEGIAHVITASDFRNKDVGRHYGVEYVDGPFEGLLARAVVVINPKGTVVHTEVVPLIGQEPDYENALASIQKS